MMHGPINIRLQLFSNLVILHTYLPMKMEQSVPKRRNTKFRRRGITQKEAYNEFSCIDAMTDGSSYSVEGSLVAFRNVTPQMLRRMSQRTWRHTFLSVQPKGSHRDPLDMVARIRSMARLVMTYYIYTLLGVL